MASPEEIQRDLSIIRKVMNDSGHLYHCVECITEEEQHALDALVRIVGSEE